MAANLRLGAYSNKINTVCRTGPSCSKGGYHVLLDKSLANTENNKKNDYPDTCPGHSDLSGGYHYPPF